MCRFSQPALEGGCRRDASALGRRGVHDQAAGTAQSGIARLRFLLVDLAGEQSIERRLTRTWIALRELCAAPYDAPEFKEYLPYWNEALGAWSSAAAWCGGCECRKNRVWQR